MVIMLGQIPKVRLNQEAYEHLKLSLNLDPKLKGKSQQKVVSDLIMSFLGASLKWHEDKGLFELYNRGQFLDLDIYLRTGWIMKEPLIEALLEIADATSWKKFAETLEKFNKEYGKR